MMNDKNAHSNICVYVLYSKAWAAISWSNLALS